MRSQLTSFHRLRLSRPFFFSSSCQTLIETTSHSQSKDHHRFYYHLALSDRRGYGLREAKTRKNRNMLSLCLIHRFCSKVDRKSCSLKAEKGPFKLPQPVDVSKLAVIDMPALDKLKAERDPEKLFHLFKANAHNRSVVENRFAFEDTISRLAGARRFDYIEQLLEQQKALPQGRREGFIIRIIMLYGKAGMPDLAVKTFYDMHLFGCNRSVKSFNATLRVLTEARKFDEIHSFFIEIPKKFCISPDGFSCNIVIKAFCEMGCLRSAYLIMEEMEKAGIRPDVVTYSTLISAFYRNDRCEIADGLWNLMVIRKCFPNLFTFNIRIQYLVNKRRPWLANRLMRKMVVLGINPDELTFNLIIKGFCKVGNLDMAKRIYDSLHSKGCRPNSKIYQTMIHYLCEGGEFDLAYTLCKDSMGKGWFPSIDSICKLLEGLIQNSKHRKSREIMRLIQGRVPPYSEEELITFQGFCSQDRKE
ncbi:hypothetical protein MRB53_011846 [Persea americana]|uniref:Uncharacterized protein n=1 Tax=Persea americana TaxID=3435 RepID=A0ACC2LW52_PERAE|nr:hypothetical protein MRB53_011846 [Persea americana]